MVVWALNFPDEYGWREIQEDWKLQRRAPELDHLPMNRVVVAAARRSLQQVAGPCEQDQRRDDSADHKPHGP